MLLLAVLNSWAEGEKKIEKKRCGEKEEVGCTATDNRTTASSSSQRGASHSGKCVLTLEVPRLSSASQGTHLKHIYMYMYMYIHIHIHVCIYVCVRESERGRERERDDCFFFSYFSFCSYDWLRLKRQSTCALYKYVC